MTTSTNKPNTLFWVIGIIALVWNSMGVNQYIQQAYQTDAFKEMYSADQLEIINNLPSWYTAIFAVAVFGSVIACIFLLLRKKASKSFFLMALLAVIVQTIYNLFMNPGKDMYTSFQYSMLILIFLFSAFLYWYSKNVDKKGWLS